ncbi:pyridoxine kinase [Ligilactobacillus sp. WC1T17]|uniref:pyridoxal kinase n=1 Tax=Ligilactobacillus ruminis TaxID=1623 RepID=A0ABY1A927_9LACO|nr:pyridoxine kinase [Ligilactobacillus ruminis]
MRADVLISQDLSCAGQVSMSCALPLFGAVNLKPTVLPTAVLSTHTGGFGNNTYLDLADEMIRILQHWQTLDLKFSAVYLGYLGANALDVLQTDLNLVTDAKTRLLVDPVMGDHGRLYRGFDMEYVAKMQALLAKANIATPNLTEAKLLLGEPLTTSPRDAAELLALAAKIQDRFELETVVLTGVEIEPQKISIACCDQNGRLWLDHKPKLAGTYFGTGDIFASVLFAALILGHDLAFAEQTAMDFVSTAILKTKQPHDQRLGPDYGAAIPALLQKLKLV